MSTVDYDAPRAAAAEPETDSLELLKEGRAKPAHDLLEAEFSDDYELPGFEILDEELTAPVIPIRPDEFRCGSCFLVLHQSMRSPARKDADTCHDCG